MGNLLSLSLSEEERSLHLAELPPDVIRKIIRVEGASMQEMALVSWDRKLFPFVSIRVLYIGMNQLADFTSMEFVDSGILACSRKISRY